MPSEPASPSPRRRFRSFPLSRCLPLLLLACPSLAGAEWDALAKLQRGGAVVSASAVDLNGGAVLQELNAQARLTPASLTKLAVAAAALSAWPADKLFQTRVMGTGQLRSGHLYGDLILQGAGDPSLDDQALWSLAAQVKGAGITEIGGKLIVNPAPFDAVGCETEDRCKALTRSDSAYDAPLSAIGVDYGAWCVDVRPTRPGAAALVRGCGVAQLPIPVIGTIKTVPDGRRSTFWIQRATTEAGDELHISGEISADSGQRLYRAMSDPARGMGLLLREALAELGVVVAGPVAIGSGALPAGAYPVALTEGLSLREQLGRMLRFSNNYIADVLTLNLGADFYNKSKLALADAGGALSAFIGESLRARKSEAAPPKLFSGSGLTPENELSADDLVTLLARQYRDPRNFPAFYGGLVVPRQAPFAFLRVGSAAWLDRVALKTGTMNDPHSVCGIAGYLRKKDGGFIAFAVIVNGGPRLRHVPLYQAMEAARKDIDDLLAKY